MGGSFFNRVGSSGALLRGGGGARAAKEFFVLLGEWFVTIIGVGE